MTHERRISEAEHEWRSCARKVKFPHAPAARAVCAEIYADSREALHPYLCEFCSHWHIGHPSHGRSQRRVAHRLEKARRKMLWKEPS